MDQERTPKYVVEFIGTFFLVLIIGTVVLGGVGDLAPVAIGFGLMAVIFGGGHISAAHYNPAITLAFVMRGRMDRVEVLPYLVAQFVAALLAALAVLVLREPPSVALDIAANGDVVPALLAEFLFTFALAWVILNVATAKNTHGNSFYGMAIGSIVMAGAFAVGDISGAAFNPAVAVALSVMGLAAWSNLWIYLVASLGGAASAAVVFKLTSPGDHVT